MNITHIISNAGTETSAMQQGFFCFATHDSFTAQKPASTSNPMTVATLREMIKDMPYLSNL